MDVRAGLWRKLKWSEVKLLSRVQLFVTPWTVAYQAPSMRFSRQEYWGELPFPSPEDLPNPGIESRSPALQAGRRFTLWATREAPEESWALKNWHFWTVVLEKTLESPLDCKEIQPIHSKGDQSWVFFGRTDAEAETAILWPPHVKSWLIGKGSGAARDWGQEEKGTTEDEIARWHHRLDRHECEWTPGVGDGQGGLECCGSWGHKESDTTEQLNWTELWAKYCFGNSGCDILRAKARNSQNLDALMLK